MQFPNKLFSNHLRSNHAPAANFAAIPKDSCADTVQCQFMSHPVVLIFRIFTTAAIKVWFDFTVGEGHVLMLWTSYVLCLHEARNDAICVFVRGILSTVNNFF
jgi:hypothetical protein